MSDFSLDPGWRPLLHDLGAEPGSVLRRAGLPEDLLVRSDVRLSTEHYFNFWRSLEAEVGERIFPLRLADAFMTESFNPPVFAALCSPNLLTAADRLALYKRLVTPQRLSVTQEDKQLRITFEWLDATVKPPASLVAAELAFIVRLVRVATRQRVTPTKVLSPIPLTPASAYTRYFGTSVSGGTEAAVWFSLADAERPFLTTNEVMWKRLRAGVA